eukprot:scaffold489180_cov34-Prasinocladus_malaysianus.AAC.1
MLKFRGHQPASSSSLTGEKYPDPVSTKSFASCLLRSSVRAPTAFSAAALSTGERTREYTRLPLGPGRLK